MTLKDTPEVREAYIATLERRLAQYRLVAIAAKAFLKADDLLLQWDSPAAANAAHVAKGRLILALAAIDKETET